MKLESQVCSLELAKQLKTLGVKQESLFYHWQTVDTEEYVEIKYFKSLEMECISAFTVAELGEFLPKKIKHDVWLIIEKGNPEGDSSKWWCGYWNGTDGYLHDRMIHQEFADTEADARAKMLIYLLENKLITL